MFRFVDVFLNVILVLSTVSLRSSISRQRLKYRIHKEGLHIAIYFKIISIIVKFCCFYIVSTISLTYLLCDIGI
jgi:hypothetical protein